MQSIEQKLHAFLVERGLFPEEATQLVTEFQQDPANEAMAGRWCESADGYPIQLFAVLWGGLRHHVLTWIDREKPKHWARPLFVDELVPSSS